MYTYIYIYIQRERDIEREIERDRYVFWFGSSAGPPVLGRGLPHLGSARQGSGHPEIKML